MNHNMYEIFFDIQKTHWWFRGKRSIILNIVRKYIKQNKENKILDIGTGAGLMLSDLTTFGTTYGIDGSDEAIYFSKKIFNGSLIKGSLPNEIPFDDNSFDLILALDVIEHIERDIESIYKIKSLLKKNGVAIITVPAYKFLWSNFDVINMHKRRYTRSDLSKKIISTELMVLKISYYCTFLFPFVCIVRLWNKIFDIVPTEELRIPNRFINKTLEIIFSSEAYLLRYISLPFGSSVIAIVRK